MNDATSYYRRPLPDELFAFASPQGRTMLAESIAAGDAGAFFPLVGNLHTQTEPAWCGFGTLVTVLNALEIDPGRVWKGPWRFFGEELLICCKALEVAAAEGLTLAEVACLAECNGGVVALHHAVDPGLTAFRQALLDSVRAPAGPFIVVNYDRRVLKQTGSGHFSPLAAWHAATDHVLVLDVAQFKYPPHWVPVAQLWRAMCSLDTDTQAPRGYLVIDKAPAVSVGSVAGESMPEPPGLHQLMHRLHGMGAKICPPGTCDDGERTCKADGHLLR